MATKQSEADSTGVEPKQPLPRSADPEVCPLCDGEYRSRMVATEPIIVSQADAAQDATCLYPIQFSDGSLGVDVFFHLDADAAHQDFGVVKDNPLYRLIGEKIEKGQDVAEASIVGYVQGQGDFDMDEIREACHELVEKGFIERSGEGVYTLSDEWGDRAYGAE